MADATPRLTRGNSDVRCTVGRAGVVVGDRCALVRHQSADFSVRERRRRRRHAAVFHFGGGGTTGANDGTTSPVTGLKYTSTSLFCLFEP